MATIKRFEDLDVWQLARTLNLNMIPILQALNEAKNYDLKKSIRPLCWLGYG